MIGVRETGTAAGGGDEGIKVLFEISTKEENTGKKEGKNATSQNSNGAESDVVWQNGSTKIFENKSEWLTTEEAATYLRKFDPNGRPSMNSVHKLVSQGRLRRRKFSGRLYFKRKEIDYLIESSEA